VAGMNKERVQEIFKKLPRKRKQVLLGVVAGHSREKILYDAELPSEGALTAHLKELYKNFNIDTVLIDADDRRSGERKRPCLVALILKAMPELANNSTSPIANKRQDLGFEVQKPIEECEREIQTLENVGLVRHEASVDLLEAVKRNAKDARKALEPDILERIRRPIVFEHCLTEIWRGVKEGKRRVIPILGDAGYGKTTLLGDIYDELDKELVKSGLGWMALVRCDYLNIDEFGDISPQTLATAIGREVCGVPDSITSIVSRLIAKYHRGVLLIDTLDILLNRDFVNAFRVVLRDIVDSGTTVVFTCRDRDYSIYLKPEYKKIAGVAEYIRPCKVIGFDDDEVEEAAEYFITKKFELSIPDRGRAFAKKINKISTDNRSLKEITHNPLLLGLLCDLYGEKGDVPTELTVSGLYEKYWEVKIADSRLYGRDSSEAIAKNKLCLQIAEILFNLAILKGYLFLFIDIDNPKLYLSESKINSAYKELLSEGVLKEEKGMVGFPHQTFLEYGIARRLATQVEDLLINQLIETIRELKVNRAQTYWWFILRQFLTIINPVDRFGYYVKQLDIEESTTFATIAFAAGSRNELTQLQNLLKYALEISKVDQDKGKVYQDKLRLAVESATPKIAWKILIELLQKSTDSLAEKIATAAGETLTQLEKPVKGYTEQALKAIQERPEKNNRQSKLFGQFLRAYTNRLKELERSADPDVLLVLREHYFLGCSGNNVRSTVLELHCASGVPEKVQRKWLLQLIQEPSPDEVKEEAAKLLEKLLPSLVGSQNSAIWESWVEGENSALHAQLTQGWGIVQAMAIGRYAAKNSKVLKKLLNQLFEYLLKKDLSKEDEAHLRRIMYAVPESIRSGAGNLVTDALVLLPVEAIHQTRLQNVADVLIALSNEVEQNLRESLADWSWSIVCTNPVDLILAVDALAKDYLRYQQLIGKLIIEEIIPKQPKKINQIVKGLRNSLEQIEDYLQVTRFTNKESRLALVRLYANRVKTCGSKDAISELCTLISDASKDVAISASKELVLLTKEKQSCPNVSDLLSLTSSPIVEVRKNCIKALQKTIDYELPFTEQDIIAICTALANEDDREVIQLLCKLVELWVYANNYAPFPVAETIGRITPRFAPQDKEGDLNSGIADSVLKTLKAFANTEDQQLIELMGRWVRPFLIKVDSKSVDIKWVISLLKAVARFDSEFIPAVVRNDFIILQVRKKIWNIRAVIAVIQSMEYTDLIEEILGSAHFSEEVKNIIRSHWGI
jgi:hypothetical protein